MFEHPDIAFSPWVAWRDRGRLIHDKQFMGVYLWGHFHQSPDSTLVPGELHLPQELIYVGETKNLNARPPGGTHHRLAHYLDTFPADPTFRYLRCRVPSRVLPG